jgi:selenocysteine-specific elongation factor
MHVIGTAGHVDHGKSTLIAALTGTHPDRLKEEQEREMTIELGFGWMTLPNGEEVGIVDVPGHRDFVENMLAGVGGIDAVLLVIAADEGVMPQSREHLAILDLLQVPGGLIVLTKIDLAPDPGWIEMIEADIRAAVTGSILEDAPILRVSALTGQGMDALVQAIMDRLQNAPERPDLGRPRLPIDRVFIMSGFGTVVTGTLTDGRFAIADEIEILPSGRRGRVRGLQTHRKQLERALPGSRTAINIAGLAADEIKRGEVVVYPSQYQAVRRLDAKFRHLKDASIRLRHGSEVKFFTGASETLARLRLLGKEELLPGEEAWIQLDLSSPVVAVRGDHYVLRRPSPGETLGGGVIVDHQPAGRHKRFDARVLKSLEASAQGSPAEILHEAAMACGMVPIREMVTRSRLDNRAVSEGLEVLLEEGLLILLDEGTPSPQADLLAISLPLWTLLQEKSLSIIAGYHQSFPLRKGIPREELKSRLKLDSRGFQALLRKLSGAGLIILTDNRLAMPDHRIQFDEIQKAGIDLLMRKFKESPYSPPSMKDCEREIGDEVVDALIELGELFPVSEEVIFRHMDYETMKAGIIAALSKNGRITMAEVRDLFNTTRKYAQAILEHLDSTGVTLRDGDFRRLVHPAR